MNKTYRNIWNTATGTWTAAAETAKGRKKGGKRAAALTAVMGAAVVLFATNAEAVDYAAGGGTAGNTGAAYGCNIAPAPLMPPGCTGSITTYGTALGDNARATSGTAVGDHASAMVGLATAIGNYSYATYSGTAVGTGAYAQGQWSTAIGRSANSVGDNSVALGIGASSAGASSVALGSASLADRGNAVSVGNATTQRQIINVAAGTQNNDAVNLGQMNTALSTKVDDALIKVGTGTDATASGRATNIAIGSGASSTGAATNSATIAIGEAATASGNAGAIAFGATTQATGQSAIAMGLRANAASNNAIVVGADAGVDANSAGSLAMGNRASVHGNTTGAASTTATNSIAIGVNAAVASTATGNANNSVAIGSNANVTADGAVALGSGSIANTANTVSVGNSTTQRKIVNMAAGDVSATSTDAVNGAQLHGVADSVASAIGGGSTVNPDGSISAPSFTVGDGSGGTKVVNSVGDAITNLDGRTITNEGAISKLADEIGSGTVGLVQQAAAGADLTVGANTDGAAVNFTGTAGDRKLTGVANGTVSAASHDAVNGSQLHGVADSVASAIGGGATVNPDGSISAPSFTVGDGAGGTTVVSSVGDVVKNLDGRTTTNEGAITKLADQIGSGTLGLVQQDPTTSAITVGASVGGSTVNFAGTGGLRTLSGVANGVNDDDVVTVSQLRATGLIDYTGKEVGAVTYDSGLSFDSVTFAGTNGTVLKQVAAGKISADSMEAVNGSQLYAMQEDFAKQYGDLSNRFDDLSGRMDDLEASPGTGDPSLGPGPGTGGEGSIVIGDGAVASGENSSAIGNGSAASGDNSSAIGQGSVASGNNGSAVGQGSVASGNNGTAVGQDAVASGENGTSLGQGSAASGSNGTAVGQGSVASGSNGTALGQGSVASGNNSSAMGQGAVASGNNSVALGAGSVADRDNSVSVGSAGNERQITNVAAGTAPTDAVNVQQMNNAVSSARQDAMGGVAAAMAVAGLPQSTQPGRTFMSMAGSTYGGEYGSAMGLSYMTRDGKWTVKAAVNTSTRGEFGGVIGGGFYW